MEITSFSFFLVYENQSIIMVLNLLQDKIALSGVIKSVLHEGVLKQIGNCLY